MYLQNNTYQITANIESTPVLNNMDLVFNLNNENLHDNYSARIFRVQAFGEESKTIAFVDSICADYEPYAILEDNLLTIILFDSIVQFDLSANRIVQLAKCHNTGGLFEIHSIKDGYIIWGEGDLFRYDRFLNQSWHFTGRDILVSPVANQHFWIDGELIHCRDFMGYQYILDMNGNLVRDYPEFCGTST